MKLLANIWKKIITVFKIIISQTLQHKIISKVLSFNLLCLSVKTCIAKKKIHTYLKHNNTN